MSENIDFLYKYRSLAESELPFVQRMILNNELYFSSADSFNDPYDCFPVLSFESTVKQYEKYFRGLLARKWPQSSRRERLSEVKRVSKFKAKGKNWEKLMESVKSELLQDLRKMSVLSLSATSDNVLLWSHYADNHRGICLKFKADSHTPFFGEAQKVHYKRERPLLNIIVNEGNEEITRALLTKADYWAYEDEWRMINPARAPGVHAYPPQLLTGVIFGAKTCPKIRQKVELWIKESNKQVELCQANMSETEFRIHIHSL